jgi:hypothetical protein
VQARIVQHTQPTLMAFLPQELLFYRRMLC